MWKIYRIVASNKVISYRFHGDCRSTSQFTKHIHSKTVEKYMVLQV